MRSYAQPLARLCAGIPHISRDEKLRRIPGENLWRNLGTMVWSGLYDDARHEYDGDQPFGQETG